MFLGKNYILANELADKMGINIANISMLRKQLESNDDYSTLVKIGNCTFVDVTSESLPRNIKSGITKNTFTDMSNKLPITYLQNEYGLRSNILKKSGIVESILKIKDKSFYEFKKEFVDTVKGCIVNVLSKDDTMDCYKDGDIDGYIKISNNKYISWYRVR